MSRLAILFLVVVAPALAICLALLGVETLHDNILGWFLLVLGVAFPAGGIIYYFIRRAPFWEASDGGQPVREEKSDRSFWLILPGFLAAFFAPPIEWMDLPAILPRTIWLQIAGLVLILAGAALRVWARINISGLYSGHMEVQTEHRLVQSGPYRFIRHPGYAGYLLMTLGVAIGYASWIGLAGILILLLPGLAYRMGVEEHLLAGRFGEEYRVYAHRSKKLIPGIW